METIAGAAARASRWAAMFVCSLGFVTPCAAGPFAADASGPPDLGVVATLLVKGDTDDSPSADVGEPPYAPARVSGTVEDLVVAANGMAPARHADVQMDSLTTSDSEVTLPSAQLLSDVARLPVRGDAPAERAPGDSLLRADSLPGMLDSLLDKGILVPEGVKTYRALPGMSGTPPVLVAGQAPQSPARDGSPESTWRETGFNVMRWTSAALAVLAVVGVVIVLVMPGLRRRMFFPDLPPLSAPQP